MAVGLNPLIKTIFFKIWQHKRERDGNTHLLVCEKDGTRDRRSRRLSELCKFVWTALSIVFYQNCRFRQEKGKNRIFVVWEIFQWSCTDDHYFYFSIKRYFQLFVLFIDCNYSLYLDTLIYIKINNFFNSYKCRKLN